jgi:ferric-dicitrate binding protein FerR (iron transport regulator)
VTQNYNSIEEVILDEYFLAWYGKTDKGKSLQWERWLNEYPGNKAIVEEAILHMDELYIKEKHITDFEVQMAYKKLESALDRGKVVEMKQPRKRLWIPAAAILILIVGYSLWNISAGHTRYNSSYGRINEFKLPDGSKVILNANSELSLKKKWQAGEDREVWLKGEAFFKVQKTPHNNRFVVHATAMDIIVTGTQFNVMNRDDESSVLLTEGSVIVRTKDGREIHMKPGDYVKLENNLPEKKQVNEEKILAWKQAKLVFDNTPMNEVASTITRHYGIKVVFSDSSIAAKTIKGVMPNDNLDVLIEALEATTEFKIQKNEKELIISNS